MADRKAPSPVAEDRSLDEVLRLYEEGREGVERAARSPFKFLDAYGAEDRDIFFGRTFEVEQALWHLHHRKHFLLYGESGCGKSSLIECGLRGQIPEEDAAFLTVRLHRPPLAALAGALQALLGEERSAPGEESELVALARRASAQLSRTLVVFLDQFEELFLFHPPEVRKAFAAALAKLLGARLDLKLILAVREEYLAHLTELETYLPGLFENRLWLHRMAPEAAAEAVRRACAVCAVGIEAGLAEQVTARLAPAGQGVELPYLQVVMDRLYRGALAAEPGHPTLTLAAYRAEGEIGDILARFLEEEVARLPDPAQGRQLLKALVSAEGTRRVLEAERLATEAEPFGAPIEPEVFAELLGRLIEARILREDPEGGRYELRHDALAATVHAWLTGLERELLELREALANRHKEFLTRREAAEALLDAAFLAYLAPYAPKLHLAPELAGFVQRSQDHARRQARRRRQIWGGLVSLAFLTLLAFTGWNAYERQRAENALADAQSARERAEVQRDRALRGESRSLDKASGEQVAAGYPELGVLLALEALPKDMAAPDRPYVVEAEAALYQAVLAPQRVKSWPGVPYEMSADGSRVLTGDDDLFRLWDTASGQLLSEWKKPEGNVLRVFVNSDATRIITVTGDSEAIRLWDTLKGEQLAVLDGHPEGTLRAAFSPDGRRVATANLDDPTARLWSAETGELIKVLEGHQGGIWDIVFSPNGHQIATGSEDTSARLWDGESGRPLAVLAGHQEPLFHVAFSPNNDVLLTVGWRMGKGGTARLWTTDSGASIAALGKVEAGSFDLELFPFSPDGKRVALSTGETATVWDATTGDQLFVLRGHEQGVAASSMGGNVTKVLFSRDGKQILTASYDETIRLSNAHTGDNLAVLPYNVIPFPTWYMGFSADSRRVIATAGNATQIWSSISGQLLARLEDQKAQAVSPDGRYLLTRSDGGTHLWDITREDIIATASAHERPLTHVTFSAEGTHFVTASVDGTARVWDARKLEVIAVLEGHDEAVVRATFSPDGERVATASLDRTARLWRQDGNPVAVFRGNPGDVHQILFGPNSRKLATFSKGDPVVLLSDAMSGAAAYSLVGHVKGVLDAAFSPDGRVLATASDDGTSRLWDTNTGEAVAVLEGHRGPVLHVTFSPDGGTVATVSDHGTSRLWNISQGTEVARLELVEKEELVSDHIEEVTFSPHGDRIATAYEATGSLWDAVSGRRIASLEDAGRVKDFVFNAERGVLMTPLGPARLWDAETGAHLTSFRGCSHPIMLADLVSGGSRLILLEQSGNLRMWDTDTAKSVAAFSTHDHQAGVNCKWHMRKYSTIKAAAISPDGRRVLSGTHDGRLRFIRLFLSTQELIDYARKLVPRQLTAEERQRFLLEVE